MLETNFLLRLILANPWQHKVAGIQLLRKGPPSTVPQEHSPRPSSRHWFIGSVWNVSWAAQYPGPPSPALSRSSVQREPSSIIAS